MELTVAIKIVLFRRSICRSYLCSMYSI